MKPGITEGMNQIHKLAQQMQKRAQEREDEQLSKGSNFSYEDEPPRERERPLKQNKVYSERELAIYFDNKDR
jgi:hypothetical protein